MGKVVLSFVASMLLVFCSNYQIVEAPKETKNNKLDKILFIETIKKLSVIDKSIALEEPIKTTVKYESLGLWEITAYTSGYESTQKKKGHPLYGVTASGEKAQEGVTVACPKSIPFDTEIYVVELDKSYKCMDRGGAITDRHLDIYLDSLKAAQDFGRQKMNVMIKVNFD